MGVHAIVTATAGQAHTVHTTLLKYGTCVTVAPAVGRHSACPAPLSTAVALLPHPEALSARHPPENMPTVSSRTLVVIGTPQALAALVATQPLLPERVAVISYLWAEDIFSGAGCRHAYELRSLCGHIQARPQACYTGVASLWRDTLHERSLSFTRTRVMQQYPGKDLFLLCVVSASCFRRQ